MKTLEPGQDVDAIVIGFEDGRVCCEYEGYKIDVLDIALSWSPVGDARDLYRPGDTIRVRILAHNPDADLYAGSVKALNPELNPYLEMAKTPKDALVEARVWQIIDDEVDIEFPQFGPGTIPPSAVVSRSKLEDDAKPGDVIQVVIKEVDAERERAIVEVPESDTH